MSIWQVRLCCKEGYGARDSMVQREGTVNIRSWCKESGVREGIRCKKSSEHKVTVQGRVWCKKNSEHTVMVQGRIVQRGGMVQKEH